MTYLSAPFIRRPVATTLLSVAVMLAGALAYFFLPVASLPQTEFPTISVQAALPGASPSVMASSIATPLERQFGRIAGITEMTSASTTGGTTINLQFDLNRDLNGAARDVQAAINAARSQLPTNLPSAPFYRKVNPTDPSILILVIESDTVPLREIYDIADSTISQKIAQVPGVGQVSLNGSSKPAVRVEANPLALSAYRLGFERLRSVLAGASVSKPKGRLLEDDRVWSISATDQLDRADQYAPLILGMSHGSAVRVRDVATVLDSVEDTRTGGFVNGHPAIQIVVNKTPGANAIATVDAILALLPTLRASLPPTIRLYSMMDRTTTIRASIHDITITLALSIVLVVLVVFAFLREGRSTLIPSISVPLSLLGTFAVMKLVGFTLDNLSLMAITIATGFVVDDAIVVIENVDRHLQAGLSPTQAAIKGSSEVGFTVIAMSISLVAAFIPMLLMGGIVGRLFREFSMVLSIAIAFSLAVSLFVTPMLCSVLLEPHSTRRHGPFYRFGDRILNRLEAAYAAGVRVVLRHQPIVLAVAILTCALTVFLYTRISKGFFPQQDTGRLFGQIRGAQDISFDDLGAKTRLVQEIVAKDDAVGNQSSFFGLNPNTPAPNVSSLFLVLKGIEERHHLSSMQVLKRLQPQFNKVIGVQVVLVPQQELNIGARSSASQFQYTLTSESLEMLNQWGPRVTAKMKQIGGIRDVISDQVNAGLTLQLDVDRDTASRFGITADQVDQTLYDAFGQRQVSIIYGPTNQYHVVVETAPQYQQDTDSLSKIYVHGTGSALVPLSAFSRFTTIKTPLVVNHQGQYPAVTISFNLAPGFALGDVAPVIESAMQDIGLPQIVHHAFAGTAQAFQSSLKSQPLLIALALVTIYLVLGMLYESLIHPLTILATLPSAGVGALLALMVTGNDFSVIALIGVVLLIGIVQKNSIMLIDFALNAERSEGKSPEQAIYEACRLRFRPILMTTMTAILGALPLALGNGVGFELRRPLGISIVGGLSVSLLLTLYTTPVLYLYFTHLSRILSGTKPHATLVIQPE
ncbi:multidrug transporter subunit MdtC [Granulicella sp. WH15]|uniref:efflux RND transporter permease subunit n=1 Tax=Granulicella sp. WH15 TaxID=2602070 RepID=UPI001366F4D6|nr:efflux RND transporter permease subunit [Granulicella sp. WH15]QHN04100.1 multidrug transporter subunit MdtC [Granulicella sp. WH15]